VSIRGFGLAVDPFSVKLLEDYASPSVMLKATVVGEFLECLRRLSTLPFGAVFMFVEESVVEKTQAAVLARIVSGLERPNVTPRMD
jgi:hypothetical protein